MLKTIELWIIHLEPRTVNLLAGIGFTLLLVLIWLPILKKIHAVKVRYDMSRCQIHRVKMEWQPYMNADPESRDPRDGFWFCEQCARENEELWI